MNTIAQREYAAVVLLLGLLVVSLLPALVHARRERYDGQRREQLIGFAKDLEAYFDQHRQYPLTFPTGADAQYVVTAATADRASAWYLRTPLQNPPAPKAGFDYEYNVFFSNGYEGQQGYYQICGGQNTCGVTVERK